MSGLLFSGYCHPDMQTLPLSTSPPIFNCPALAYDQAGVEPSHLYHLMQLDLEELQRASAAGRAGVRDTEQGDAADTAVAAPPQGPMVPTVAGRLSNVAKDDVQQYSQQDGAHDLKPLGSLVNFNPVQIGSTVTFKPVKM